jgi:aminoglycoside phosphotransferase (APT) family kinase protein
MTEPVDYRQVRKIVSELLGEAPRSLCRIVNRFGGMSEVYEAELSCGAVIVRTNANADMFRGAAHNIRVLRELGLPVPRLLACDASLESFPVAVMVLEKIPGRDLSYELSCMTRAQMSALAEQLAAYQRIVTTLPLGSGYGYVNIGEQGPHSSWWEMIRPNPESPLLDKEPLRRWAKETARLLEHNKPYFLRVVPTCFLDDITVKNVLMQDGVLQGLVDFDCVCYGDPLWWISLTAVGTVCDVGADALFYSDELARFWTLTDEQEAILPLYCAVMGMGFYCRYAELETDEWRMRMGGANESWLIRAGME